MIPYMNPTVNLLVGNQEVLIVDLGEGGEQVFSWDVEGGRQQVE